MVKPDLDTVATLPDAPPAAGPDRALEPPPADPCPPGVALPETGCAADAEEDVARPTESPITGAKTAAATIRPIFLFGSNRRTLGQPVCRAIATEADPPGADSTGKGATASDLPGPAATGGIGVALERARSGSTRRGFVDSYSFMIAVLLGR